MGNISILKCLKFKVGKLFCLYLDQSWSHFLFIFRVFYSKLQCSLQPLKKASHWKWFCSVSDSAFNHRSNNWYLLGSNPSETGMGWKLGLHGEHLSLARLCSCRSADRTSVLHSEVIGSGTGLGVQRGTKVKPSMPLNSYICGYLRENSLGLICRLVLRWNMSRLHGAFLVVQRP